MMRSFKIGHWVALVCMAGLVTGCGSTRETAWDTSGGDVALDAATQAKVNDLLNQANAAGDQRADIRQAKAAVDALAEATTLDPSNAELKRNYARFVEFYQGFRPREEAEPEAAEESVEPAPDQPPAEA